MIKTIVAIGLTSLCGLSGLKQVIATDTLNNNVYVGLDVQNILNRNIYEYIELNDLQSTIETYGDLYFAYAYIDDSYYIPNLENEASLLLAPRNTNNANQPILICPREIKHRLENTRYVTEYTTLDGKKYGYYDEDYIPIGVVYNPNNLADENYLFTIDDDEENGIYLCKIQNNYHVRQYTVGGMFAPFKDNGTDKNTIYQTTQRTNPVEQVLTKPFINNGFYYDLFNVYGANRLNSDSTYDVQYMSALYMNHFSNYNVIANEPIYTHDETHNVMTDNTQWNFEGANRVIILESNYVSLINSKYQTQEQCLINHTKQGVTTVINGNGNVGDVFSIISQAFNGFGSFFSVALLPGITIGAIVLIPLIIGLILWLIQLFKRH